MAVNVPRRQASRSDTSSGSPSSSSSSYSCSPSTPQHSLDKSSRADTCFSSSCERRQSFLSPSFAQSEHTVIEIGDPEGVPRLITCVRASQGFEWNPEIFLPSYLESDFESPDRLRERVVDIVLSDEETWQLLPH